jgi:hypothetical protein
MLAAVFAAKEVPSSLLGEIDKYKEFHLPDWPSVEASISGTHESFDVYFDFVAKLGARLKSLWVE